MNRKKYLALNIASSLLLQITTIICGFIVPRLILKHFGSEVNGLVHSIAQYLAVISFLELGVGAVVQSSLYKPIADNDNRMISSIVVSASRFFKKIAFILLIYIVFLIIFFPLLVNRSFDWIFTASLIVVISISSFSQYYFGVVDRLLLTAAQRGFIQYTAQTVTIILNTVACIILINMDASIHMVKLVSSLIFLLRPIFLRCYNDRTFKIDRNIKCIGEPIKQKWNGAAQHFASIVLDGTAMIVLTIMTTLANVSVYSIYWLVVSGVKRLELSLTGGSGSFIGDLWARQELEKLNKAFSWVEWSLHTGTVLIFGCTSILIVPFIRVYTSGVNDANYIQPVFAYILVFAHMAHCFRLPYNMIILAAGHYKETQNNYIVAAIGNLLIAFVGVYFWGIVGIAIGAAFALYYQTVWMAHYVSENIIKWPITRFWKQMMVNLVSLSILLIASNFVHLNVNTYFEWCILALKIGTMSLIIIIIVNYIFYKEHILYLLHKLELKT